MWWVKTDKNKISGLTVTRKITEAILILYYANMMARKYRKHKMKSRVDYLRLEGLVKFINCSCGNNNNQN